MNPAPLARVLKVVGIITGKSIRADLVEMVNGVLEMIYRDENLLWKYFKADGCRSVTTFYEPCQNRAAVAFKAIVMPPNVINVRELTMDGVPFRITEERVDPTCWAYTRSKCDLPAEHMPPRLLEADIPLCNDSGQVTFRSDCTADCGKLVGVRYLDRNGNEQREDIELSTSRTPTSVSVVQFLEITFPEREGTITVETVDGFRLGCYHPSIFIPLHEWFRLTLGCSGSVMQYRGLSTLAPVVFDTDPVPFSDSYLWRLAIKAYENVDSMELTPGQNNGLTRIYNQLGRVGVADLATENANFNTVIPSNLAKTTLGAARTLSRRGRSFRQY